MNEITQASPFLRPGGKCRSTLALTPKGSVVYPRRSGDSCVPVLVPREFAVPASAAAQHSKCPACALFVARLGSIVECCQVARQGVELGVESAYGHVVKRTGCRQLFRV